MINTKSSFYYVDPINSDNFYIDFDEGSGPLVGEAPIGSFTLNELPIAIEAALNQVGTNVYTVVFDRDERRFIINSSGPVSLLVNSGVSNGNDVYPLLGFTGADRPLGVTHTSNIQAGSEYRPQFWLQDYVDEADNQQAVSAAVNRTTVGDVEIVKFGIEKFFEFMITLATDIPQGDGTFLDNDPNGVANLRSFMQFCVQKNNLEFMPDRNNKSFFYKVLLESTVKSKDGIGYMLKELYGKSLPGYFESGKLVFRLRES